MIRALCEREYLQPSSVLSLDSDRVQRIEHSSGECVSCERGDITSELYCMSITDYTTQRIWKHFEKAHVCPHYRKIVRTRMDNCKSYSTDLKLGLQQIFDSFGYLVRFLVFE